MHFFIIIASIFAAVALAMPAETATNATLTPEMLSTIEFANALMNATGMDSAARACDYKFRKCYTVSIHDPNFYYNQHKMIKIADTFSIRHALELLLVML